MSNPIQLHHLHSFLGTLGNCAIRRGLFVTAINQVFPVMGVDQTCFLFVCLFKMDKY